MLTFLAWLILLVLCWPLAPLALRLGSTVYHGVFLAGSSRTTRERSTELDLVRPAWEYLDPAFAPRHPRVIDSPMAKLVHACDETPS